MKGGDEAIPELELVTRSPRLKVAGGLCAAIVGVGVLLALSNGDDSPSGDRAEQGPTTSVENARETADLNHDLTAGPPTSIALGVPRDVPSVAAALQPMITMPMTLASFGHTGDAVLGSLPVGGLESGSGAGTLVVVAAADLVYVIDFPTRDVRVWDTPEALVDEHLVALPGMVVVVGETHVWARSVAGSDMPWVDLGAAHRVRPSTREGRVWLRSLNEDSSVADAPLRWSEIDLDGHVYRSMTRDRDIWFGTPELMSGLGSDVFRMTDEFRPEWSPFLAGGIVIAEGINDVVTKECTRATGCSRVWYDVGTWESRGSLHDDLANNIDVLFGGRLSPDGRFVTSETDAGRLDVSSVASGQQLPTDCLSEGGHSWTAESDLLACATAEGVRVYDTSTGQTLGLARVGADPSPFIFVAPPDEPDS